MIFNDLGNQPLTFVFLNGLFFKIFANSTKHKTLVLGNFPVKRKWGFGTF